LIVEEYLQATCVDRPPARETNRDASFHIDQHVKLAIQAVLCRDVFRDGGGAVIGPGPGSDGSRENQARIWRQPHSARRIAFFCYHENGEGTLVEHTFIWLTLVQHEDLSLSLSPDRYNGSIYQLPPRPGGNRSSISWKAGNRMSLIEWRRTMSYFRSVVTGSRAAGGG
jgi:hypothetical protein